MLNNGAFDIVIGLVFIYLLYSLLATTIQEIIANKLSYRAKFLEKGIMRMLNDYLDDDTAWVKRIFNSLSINKLPPATNGEGEFSKAFYDHPLIKYLGENGKYRKPAYLKSESFSKVVIDLLKGINLKPGADPKPLIEAALKEGILNWNPSAKPDDKPVKSIPDDTLKFLNSLWVDAEGDLGKFKTMLESWYDETMDRVSGWYKKYSQFILLLIGFVIAIVFNVDTIKIVGTLERDPKLREQIVGQAQAFLKVHPNLDKEKADVKAVNKRQADSIMPNLKDSAAKDSIAKIASLLKRKNDSTDAEYEAIRQKGISLNKQANDLVQGDVKKMNESLGTGIHHLGIKKPNAFWKFMKAVFGWILTAIALSLGAPFWFDLLNKLMKLRSSITEGKDSGKKKQKQT